jgi:MFS family permease
MSWVYRKTSICRVKTSRGQQRHSSSAMLSLNGLRVDISLPPESSEAEDSRAGILLQNFPVPKVLGYNILLWGIILCCSATCHDTASIIAVRTLLGMCEAIIAPALIVFTSRWYIKAEAPLRYGIWYCGLGAGQIVGGLISFSAQHSSSTFAGWRVMFICIGIVNVLVALLILFTLPGESSFATEQQWFCLQA